MESFDLEQFQRSAIERVAQSCRQKEALKPILEQLRELTQTAATQIAACPSDRSHIDCGPGCSSCCVVNVSTLMPEGIAISHHLRQQLEEQSAAAAARLDALWCAVRGLDDEDRLFLNRSCAFLDDRGCCGIYPQRPLLCRSVSSTSAQRCRDALAGKLMGEETSVLMHQFQQTVYEALFTGVAAGLEEKGLDGRSFQLTGLVRYLLKCPDAEEEWLAGKRLSWQELY